MARVHTEFISLSKKEFDELWACIPKVFGSCIVYREVPLNYQAHLERTAEKQCRILIKRKYVK